MVWPVLGSQRWEPSYSGTGRRHSTVSGLFVLVDGSPPDSDGRAQADRLRMACKRSGVRIPIAPPEVKRINSNTEPVNFRALEGQIDGKLRSVVRCLACCDSVPGAAASR
jgi:hypothetical protein